MEPFVRLLPLEVYKAYLKWDEGYFAAQKTDSELKQSGVAHEEIKFPTLEDLLELKRFLICILYHSGFSFNLTPE